METNDNTHTEFCALSPNILFSGKFQFRQSVYYQVRNGVNAHMPCCMGYLLLFQYISLKD